MTAADIAREAGLAEWNAAHPLRFVVPSAKQARRLWSAEECAEHTAFTVDLDTERLDIGMAATNGCRRLAG